MIRNIHIIILLLLVSAANACYLEEGDDDCCTEQTPCHEKCQKLFSEAQLDYYKKNIGEKEYITKLESALECEIQCREYLDHCSHDDDDDDDDDDECSSECKQCDNEDSNENNGCDKNIANNNSSS